MRGLVLPGVVLPAPRSACGGDGWRAPTLGGCNCKGCSSRRRAGLAAAAAAGGCSCPQLVHAVIAEGVGRASGLLLLLLPPSLLLRLLAKPLLQLLSLLQQLLPLLLRRTALIAPAGNAAMSPVLLARAKLLDSRCGGQLMQALPVLGVQGACNPLPAMYGVAGAVAAAAEAEERAGMACCMPLNVLRRTGAGLPRDAAGGGGAGPGAVAGPLAQLPLKNAAADIASAPPSALKPPCGGSTGDEGSCCCQVSKPASVAASGVLLFAQWLAVLVQALLPTKAACASTARNCRTNALL